MARKAGQLISRGRRTWLVRVSLGRDPETGTRRYHNRTVHGSFREAQTYLVAGFQSDGYRRRDELVYLMFTERGQQVMRFSMRDNRTMFPFTFADSEPRGTSANGSWVTKSLVAGAFRKERVGVPADSRPTGQHM
jgi:hypothetical protein